MGDVLTAIVSPTGMLSAAALGFVSSLLTQKEEAPTPIQRVDPRIDKTAKQQAEQLDAAELGGEESEKRKRKSAKAKFKIDKEPDTEPIESGITFDSDKTKVTGVQI